MDMKSVRLGYEEFGIEEYYKIYKDTYKNPKSKIVSELVSYGEQYWGYGNKVLDLCCGSGEVTLSLKGDKEILGFDPYTYELYEKNTHKRCIIGDFDTILSGGLNVYRFDTIICSFALHLCEESKLSYVLWQLSLICDKLVIITPHKRPECEGSAFRLIDSYRKDKCTIKLYYSKNFDLI